MSRDNALIIHVRLLQARLKNKSQFPYFSNIHRVICIYTCTLSGDVHVHVHVLGYNVNVHVNHPVHCIKHTQITTPTQREGGGASPLLYISTSFYSAFLFSQTNALNRL